MTKDEQGKEIADRIARLSSIRGELVVNRASMKKSIDLLAAVGQLMQTSQNRVWPQPDYVEPIDPWPSKESLDSLANVISALKKEADALIGELKGLGLDPDLFAINGD